MNDINIRYTDMISEVSHIVSTVYTFIRPETEISIAHLFPLAKKYIQEHDTLIHRIQSEDPEDRKKPMWIYVKPDTQANLLKVSKKAFPSQITFSIWHEPANKYFMVKLSIHSQVHVPGVCDVHHSEAIACINELIRCLRYCYQNEEMNYIDLKCHMSNYKMHLEDGKKFSIYHLKNTLTETDTGKIRVDHLHIYTFLKERTWSRDVLEDITKKAFLPCRMYINYNSLINIMKELRCDLVYDIMVKVNMIYTDSKTANAFIHIFLNSLLNKILKKLDEEDDNCVVLHHIKHEKEGSYLIIFRYISMIDCDITVQVFMSGKININSCLDYRITQRIRDWFLHIIEKNFRICF
jgi:hypothetical protein